MKFKDLIELVWNNMWRRKTRTILTMIGVIIGSVAIFVIVSLGNGFQRYISSQLSSLGDVNTISVYPYNDMASAYDNSSNKKNKKSILNEKSLKELKNLPYTKYIVPKISSFGSLEYKKAKFNSTQILGMSFKDYSKDHKLQFGKYPSSENECVIGYKLAAYIIDSKNSDKVKDEEIKSLLKKDVKIKLSKGGTSSEEDSKYFTLKVSGISKEGYSDDFIVKLPIETALEFEKWRLGKSDIIKDSGYQSIDVVVKDRENITETEKYLKDKGYLYSSFKEIQSGVNKTLNGVKLILGALGGISLLVAAFGIANTMNMAIFERKKEIGIMKVVGASLRDVKGIFIGEASAIGFMGGLIGIIIGITLNWLINIVLKTRLSTPESPVSFTSISPGLIIFVLVFASFVGFLSGLYPATKAAKLNVINSIKDE